MITILIVIVGILAVAKLFFLIAFIRWGSCWGAKPDEYAMRMPGDAYLDSGPAVRTAMTRAISINAPPETVWPWLAQLGRGAGWYSIDRLDNGGKTSAAHIVSWLPEPQIGDATAIGYLRHLEMDRGLTWWADGIKFMGAASRLVTDIRLSPEGAGSRLVIRMSADIAGFTARPALWTFQFIDTIMARKQLLGIKERVERYGDRGSDPNQPETGSRDQYQLYEVIYASDEKAGVSGKGDAHLHRTAVEAEILKEGLETE